MSDLARCGVCPAVEGSVDDQTRPDAAANLDQDEVALLGVPPVLGEGSHRSVVGHGYGMVESAFESSG
jgi:hypothetical protein